MPFTNPKTWTNAAVYRDELNTYLRDNLDALKNPPTAVYESIGRSTDFSTTSTSFTDVGAEMELTITTTGDGAGGNGDVFVWLLGALYSSTAIRIYFRVLMDGAVQNADDGLLVSEGTGLRPISFLIPIRGIAAGSHSFKLQWKVSSGTGVLCANAGTSTRDIKAQFGVREAS